MASTVLPNGIIIPEKFSRDWYSDLYHNWQELDNLLGGGTPKDGTLTIQKNGATVGTFSANQATNETVNITVPDVNNGTLTIQKNGATVDTFTANSSTDKTVNIEVPTKTSDLTNDSGFITEDTTKIPLAGSNAISGDLIPATDGTVNLGGVSYQWNNAYIKSLTINGVACGDILTHNAAEFVPVTGGAVMAGAILARTVNNSELDLSGGKGWGNGASISLHGKDDTGMLYMYATDGTYTSGLNLSPSGDATLYNNGIVKNLAMQEDVIPRSGGQVMMGSLYRTNNTSSFAIGGGSSWNGGGSIELYGNGWSETNIRGAIRIQPAMNEGSIKHMTLFPDGTWTWDGTAVQITSDQRLKQQISKIDDKLLDAWEDVELSQFKYNDAVDEKGKDKARLHTGYVVQQIQKACESHGVDVSRYGLYCHEEYPEETEEVEVTQKDGTKTKERKVIREASEHYSLRYTEVYAVECMYLRRCIAKLTARIEELEKGNNTK